MLHFISSFISCIIAFAYCAEKNCASKKVVRNVFITFFNNVPFCMKQSFLLFFLFKNALVRRSFTLSSFKRFCIQSPFYGMHYGLQPLLASFQRKVYMNFLRGKRSSASWLSFMLLNNTVDNSMRQPDLRQNSLILSCTEEGGRTSLM